VKYRTSTQYNQSVLMSIMHFPVKQWKYKKQGTNNDDCTLFTF